MNYKIDKKSNLPQYIQIANQLSDHIRAGLIKTGSKLPSVRKLSELACISHVTADKVFRNLESKGLIERFQGSGSFVVFDSPFNAEEELNSEYVRTQFGLLKDSKNFRSLLVNLLKNTSHSCKYNFSYALLNPEFLNSIMPTIEELASDSDLFNLPRTYGDMKGLVVLREILIETFPSDYSVEEILITCGNQHGIALVVQALVNEGDYVMIETPTFTGAVDILSNSQANLLPIKIYENGFDAIYIEELCIKYTPKLFFLTPNFSNPTGYCLTVEEREELIKLAKKYNFYIVEDDHWSELSFDEKIVPLALMKNASTHVIYLRGFSKIIGPDTRIGALFAPERIIDRVKSVITLQSLGVSLLPQKYLYGLIKQGYYRRIKRVIMADLRKRSLLVNNYLLPLKDYGVEYEIPEGGLNYWIKLPDDKNSEELLFNIMYENGITFLPGSITDVNISSNSGSYIRLNYSYLSYNNFKVGLEKFVKLLIEQLNA